MPPDPVSRLDLERHVLGVLSPQEREALEARATADPALQARLERVGREVADAAEGLPDLELPVDAPSRSRWFTWAPMLLVALGLVVVLPVAVRALPPTPPVQTFRGGMDLQIWQIRDGAPQAQGALVQGKAGDHIQLEVQTDRQAWLSVYNVQDDGTVQTYLAPETLHPLTIGRSAVVLDDYAGSERIFVLLSESPINELQVQDAVQNAWATPLADMDTLSGLPTRTQRSILVLK